MSNDDSRKSYWNDQYLNYWKARVGEAGDGKSKIVSGDSNTEDNSVYQRVFDKHGFNSGDLLEVGCAWGRMFQLYIDFGLQVAGVDISKAMVDAAREDWSNDKRISSINESPAEHLPFDDESFDNLACLATLDATYQHEAVSEFLRVTKPGARIYFTGKNDNYFPDDKEAYDAEVGARRKNHPNYFTDTKKLIQLLLNQGHKLDAVYCFPRRGDFSAFNYVSDVDGRFYEYFLVITRGKKFSELPEFSDAYSKTFYEIEGNDV